MTGPDERTRTRWSDKPFPACCLHCYHCTPGGSCGHAQRELVTEFFARYPDASCPIYGGLEPSEADPVVSAILSGQYRLDDAVDR